MLERPQWVNLNGTWDFALDADACWRIPDEVEWNSSIEVPFAPETLASGVGNTGFFLAVWYRRTIETPKLDPKKRHILHFGAVDHSASVWINGRLAVQH